MGFLGWIKGRAARQQQPATETAKRPERAKEMYTRQAAEEVANRLAPTPDQQDRARRIGEEMRKATQHLGQSGPAPSDAPADGGSNSAQLQKQHQQDKAQETLSPTDDAKGKTAAREKHPVQEKPPQRAPQTLPRRPPSWER
jgi:hypothetical protein